MGKMLEMGQALDLQGYSQTILVFLLRDWLKKDLPHGEKMTKMGITCLRSERI